MGQLVDEVKRWNTPILGAYLLWRFTLGYSQHHRTGDSPIGLLHFVAMAILTKQELSDPISNSRKGLQSYVRSFEENKHTDLLLSIHDRVNLKRENALSSIDIGIAEGLLVWDHTSGKLFARELTDKARPGKAIKSSIKRSGNKAEILGKWFSQHELPEIAAYLKVAF